MEPRSFVYKDVVRLLFGGGCSHREIAKATGCSTGTVSNIKRRLGDRGVDVDTALGMSEQKLRALLGVRFRRVERTRTSSALEDLSLQG